MPNRNQIPGADLIGRGYSVFGKVLPADGNSLDLRRPCYDVGAIESKTYSVGSTIFGVPDNVQVSTNTGTKTEVAFGESRASYLSDVAAEANITSSYGLFSGELGGNFSATSLKESEGWYATVSEAQTVFYLSMINDAPLATEFATAVADLEFKTFASNPYPYFDFFDLFGTHYIDTVMLGGNVYLDCVHHQAMQFSTDEIKANLSLSYGALFDLTGSGSWNQVKTETVQNTTMTLRTVGGTANEGPAGATSIGVDLSKTYNAWRTTVQDRPVPVKASYKEIWRLVEEEGVRSQLKVALGSYLSNRLNLISEPGWAGFLTQLNGKVIYKQPHADDVCGLQIIAIDRTKTPLNSVYNQTFSLAGARLDTFWEDVYQNLAAQGIPGNKDLIVTFATFGPFPLHFIPEGDLVAFLQSLGADTSQADINTLGYWLSYKTGGSATGIQYAIVGIPNGSAGLELFLNWNGVLEPTSYSMDFILQPNPNELETGKTAFVPRSLGISNEVASFRIF